MCVCCVVSVFVWCVCVREREKCYLHLSFVLQEFFKEDGPNYIPTAVRALKQSCETIRNNSKWLARDRDAIKRFLDQPGA